MHLMFAAGSLLLFSSQLHCLRNQILQSMQLSEFLAIEVYVFQTS